MKLKSSLLILSLVSVLIYVSLAGKKNMVYKEKVTLFKEVNPATDLGVGFKIKHFWENNFEEKTFITQDFKLGSFNDIMDSVKTLPLINNKQPIFNDYVKFAFVKYNPDAANDTLYFDGTKKWWIIQNGKTFQYNDKKENIKYNLQYFYPIFRDCPPVWDR